jgi:hypothetical protein
MKQYFMAPFLASWARALFHVLAESGAERGKEEIEEEEEEADCVYPTAYGHRIIHCHAIPLSLKFQLELP